MTSWISIAAKHKRDFDLYNTLSRAHTHIHTSRIVKNPTGHGYHVADRKQMACWGKKRQREGKPKKAREKCFPALSPLPPCLPPSSLYPRLEGKRKTEVPVAFGGWISGLWRPHQSHSLPWENFSENGSTVLG